MLTLCLLEVISLSNWHLSIDEPSQHHTEHCNSGKIFNFRTTFKKPLSILIFQF